MPEITTAPTKHYHPWFIAKSGKLAYRVHAGFPVRENANRYGRKRAEHGFMVRQCADDRCPLRTEARDWLVDDETIPEDLRWAL